LDIQRDPSFVGMTGGRTFFLLSVEIATIVTLFFVIPTKEGSYWFKTDIKNCYI